MRNTILLGFALILFACRPSVDMKYTESCCDGAEVEVSLPTEDTTRIFLPTAFSPNADGFNDLYRSFIYPAPQSYHLTISKGKRNIIFESDDPMELWDGSLDGFLAVSTGKYQVHITGMTAQGNDFSASSSLCLFRFDPVACTGDYQEFPSSCTFPDQIDQLQGIVSNTFDQYCE